MDVPLRCHLTQRLHAGDSVIISVQWRALFDRGVIIYAAHIDTERDCGGLYGHQIVTSDPTLLLRLITRRVAAYRHYPGGWDTEYYPTYILTDAQIERLIGEFAEPTAVCSIGPRQQLAGEVFFPISYIDRTPGAMEPYNLVLVEAAIARARTWIRRRIPRGRELTMAVYKEYRATMAVRELIWPRFYYVCVEEGRADAPPAQSEGTGDTVDRAAAV